MVNFRGKTDGQPTKVSFALQMKSSMGDQEA